MNPSAQTFDYEKFEGKYKIKFANKSLLKQAFSHSSYVNENNRRSIESNERLEFLGDAVLELTMSDYLYTSFPEMTEGELTKLRASVVCEPALVRYANDLGFGEFVLLGKGEESMGGRQRPALLEDVFEAFIGALYLDKGLPAVVPFLQQHVFPKVRKNVSSHDMDFKSQLQEYVQRKNLGEIHYEIIREKGPAHDKEFVIKAKVGQAQKGIGTGRSKKEAEQEAAQKAIKNLKHR